jgi:hypothetical protein
MSVVGFENALFRVGDEPFGKLIDLSEFMFVGAKDGQQIGVMPKPVNMEFGYEFPATIAITFGEGPFAHAEVRQMCRTLSQIVEGIIGKLGPFAIASDIHGREEDGGQNLAQVTARIGHLSEPAKSLIQGLPAPSHTAPPDRSTDLPGEISI